LEASLGFSIERVEVLLLIAAIVAMVARRFRLPYTVGLVFAGIGMALANVSPGVQLTRQLIFTLFLPPLIFEAAFQIRWAEFRRDLPVLLTFATLGVLISAAITAAGLHAFANWSWPVAILVGVLIAATDPVSVIALFREIGVHGRMRLLVEAESLLNDGTVAVLFVVALAALAGGQVQPLGVAASFVITVAGGVLCGGAIAMLLLVLAGRTDDHLIEITFSTVAAYGSFLIAEHFHLSGVLATLAAGIVLANAGSLGSFSDKGREAVESFWEYVAFAVNSLVFLLIGSSVTAQTVARAWIPSLLAIVFVLAGRAVSVYGCSALFARSSQKIDRMQQHVLFWGGLRGALALALVLGLPDDLERRQEIVAVTFAVVVFSVVVQGLTVAPLLRRLERRPGA
jgi:CPA1 family monovalent cation:H+ antiporter